jgi:ABC-type lipoprotein export system ATPase subunit
LYREILSDVQFKKKLIAGIELNIKLSDETINKYQLIVSTDYFHAILWFDISKIDEAWEKIKNLIKANVEGFENIEDMSSKEISKKMEGIPIELEKLQVALSSVNYYFIFHENKGDRNLSDYLKNNIESNEKYKDKLFYYNNSLAVEGGRRSKAISKYFEEELNTIVSRFLFSDAKTIDEIGQKYTWINYSGEFKNLILPISDPEMRVFTSDEVTDNPQKNKNNYLEAIKFDVKRKIREDDGTEKEVKETKTIYFSPGLNGIIGSRGSGKTMLGNILGNRDTNTYIDYIDTNTIEYKLKDSEFTKNVPTCKYLKQNTLLKIYEEGKFEELDFIKVYYNELLEKKKASVALTIQEIIKNLNLEKKNISEFYQKYKGNTIFWDFLQNAVSVDNLLLEVKTSDFSNNDEEVDVVEDKMIIINQSLNSLLEELNKIKFSNDYTESKYFSEIIEEYKNETLKIVKTLIENSNSFSTKIKSYDRILFKLRNAYIKAYVELTKSENSEIDNESTIYQEKLGELNLFFDDLFKLRNFLKRGFIEILKDYDKIYENNLDRTLSLNGTDEIIISTTLKDKREYIDILKEQLKMENEDYSDYLVDMLLNSNNIEKIKKYFNGNKYKSLSSINDYIEKYYGNLTAILEEIKKISLKISYNGKPLEKYSPGKRSEILLDIFLHEDVIGSDQYKYIILDQPEDNLDTSTIIVKLVDKIRKMKLDKQFFVISHSAPVVINADSDMIICSKETSNEIDYDSGKINDPILKDSIVNILDGGEKNLKMRLHKYDFKYEEE